MVFHSFKFDDALMTNMYFLNRVGVLVYFIRNNSVPILGTDIRQAWLVFGCLEFKAAQRFSNTIQKRTGDFENSKMNILACLEKRNTFQSITLFLKQN